MAIRSTVVGITTEPHISEVTTRRILAYAAGIGDTNPWYFDDSAATGIVAHPAFCTALEWPVALALRQHPQFQLTKEEALRGVHAEQDSTFYRPIRPGDRLSTTATLVQIRIIKPGAFVLTKFQTVDATTGEPVVTSYSSTIYRGIPVDGPDALIEEAPPLPEKHNSLAMPEEVTIPITREAPHIYTECAQIWNPIHTERRVALAAGLPDIILHGTATWALAASHLINRCASGNPTRLQRLAGRFSAMVIPGTRITLKYGTILDEEKIISYLVCNAEGAPAISHGLAVITLPD
jgi:acyl dehydratase